MFNTLNAAVEKANRLAKKNDKEYFVVFEDGEFDVTDTYGLDTIYAGIHDENIRYSTLDG